MKQLIGLRNRQRGPFRPARCRYPLAFLAVLLWGADLAAAEVHTWTDENGVVHFSQTPRPQGTDQVIEAEEAYRPGSVPASPPDVDTGAQVSGPEQGEAPLSAAQARREQIAQTREARRQQQAEAENLCALHRDRLERIEPARRVFYTDENGEAVRMDDDERIALVEESKAYLAENCSD